MKVLIVRDNKVELGADSAVLRCGEPVFVPDPIEDWVSLVAPAVRLCRLGMHMGRNARAYFDSLSTFHILMPAPGKAPQGIPYALIDRTFSPGEWRAIAPDKDQDTISLTVRRTPISARHSEASDTIEVQKGFSINSLGATDTIARISQFCTLKTGDVVIFADFAAELGAPKLDTAIEAHLDSAKSLSVKIK